MSASASVPEEGQALLERLEHWCRVQPDKVKKGIERGMGVVVGY